MAKGKICSVNGCGGVFNCKGFCRKHYMRFKKFGSPLITKSTPTGEVQYFFNNYVISYSSEECLIWPYTVNKFGYAFMTYNGRNSSVSRILCEIANGPPPKGRIHAAHTCGKGKQGCVNKNHLLWKTPKENALDKVKHGTSPIGEKNPKAKLTYSQIFEIKEMLGHLNQDEIALRFSVSPQTISAIKNGLIWNHLPQS